MHPSHHRAGLWSPWPAGPTTPSILNIDPIRAAPPLTHGASDGTERHRHICHFIKDDVIYCYILAEASPAYFVFVTFCFVTALEQKSSKWWTLPGTAHQSKHVFVSEQFLNDYQCKANCVCVRVCMHVCGRSYWGNPLWPESKHHRFTQDKTSQQEKEGDKWRRGKSVLVWRGLLKPHQWANQEGHPATMNPQA